MTGNASGERPVRMGKPYIPDFWQIVTVVFLLLAGLFLVYPYAGLVLRSFVSAETGKPSLENYALFFNFAYYFNTLLHSFAVSLSTTVLALMLGIPMAYVFSRYDIPGKKILKILIIISLLSPPFIGAYSWIMLLGRNGFITKLLAQVGITVPTIYGFRGLLLVFTLKLFPFVFLYVSGALGSVDSSLEEAAESLGVRGIRKLLTVTFPLILPTITAGAVMVFMTSLADLGTPMLIGEGYKVLPVLVYEEYMSEVGGNAAMASTLSVIIVLCSLSMLFLQKLVINKRNYTMNGTRPPAVRNLRLPMRIILTIGSYAVAIAAIAPQITTVTTSFIKTRGPLFIKGFSLDSYRSVWYKLSSNIVHTFTYGGIAIVFMILIGMLSAYLIVRRRSKATMILDTLLMSPYVIPGAVLGIILVMAFNKKPLILTGTAMIMIISYVIRKMPSIVRSSSAILYQLDPAVEEASISLGVSPMKTFFKVTAIMMLPGVISGAILSWIATINELSSTLILYSGRTGTISVAIYTEIFKDGYGTAAALASILTLATIVSLFIFDRITEGKGSVV